MWRCPVTRVSDFYTCEFGANLFVCIKLCLICVLHSEEIQENETKKFTNVCYIGHFSHIGHTQAETKYIYTKNTRVSINNVSIDKK